MAMNAAVLMQVTVAGTISVTVSNATAFVNDTNAPIAFSSAIASYLGGNSSITSILMNPTINVVLSLRSQSQQVVASYVISASAQSPANATLGGNLVGQFIQTNATALASAVTANLVALQDPMATSFGVQITSFSAPTMSMAVVPATTVAPTATSAATPVGSTASPITTMGSGAAVLTQVTVTGTVSLTVSNATAFVNDPNTQAAFITAIYAYLGGNSNITSTFTGGETINVVLTVGSSRRVASLARRTQTQPQRVVATYTITAIAQSPASATLGGNLIGQFIQTNATALASSVTANLVALQDPIATSSGLQITGFSAPVMSTAPASTATVPSTTMGKKAAASMANQQFFPTVVTCFAFLVVGMRM